VWSEVVPFFGWSQGQKSRRGRHAAVGEEKPRLPQGVAQAVTRDPFVCRGTTGPGPNSWVKKSATQERAGVAEQLARG